MAVLVCFSPDCQLYCIPWTEELTCGLSNAEEEEEEVPCRMGVMKKKGVAALKTDGN